MNIRIKQVEILVVCPTCGELLNLLVEDGTEVFLHCGELHNIKRNLAPEVQIVVGRDGNKYCSYSKKQFAYNYDTHEYLCDCPDCPYGKVLGCCQGTVVGGVQRHDDTFGFSDEDMDVTEGRINAFAPPASMLKILVGERMETMIAFSATQDPEVPAKIYYSNHKKGLVVEYKEFDGTKVTTGILEQLEGYAGYYLLPKGHPDRKNVFIYYQNGDVVTYKNGNYEYEVNYKNERRLYDLLCFYHKDDGFFIDMPRGKTMKNFEFKAGGRYYFFPQHKLRSKEGQLFREISEEYVYRVNETHYNPNANRDVTNYHYLIEGSHVPIVKALAKRLTRPTSQKHYPGLSEHQRMTLYENCRPISTKKGLFTLYEKDENDLESYDEYNYHYRHLRFIGDHIYYSLYSKIPIQRIKETIVPKWYYIGAPLEEFLNIIQKELSLKMKASVSKNDFTSYIEALHYAITEKELFAFFEGLNECIEGLSLVDELIIFNSFKKEAIKALTQIDLGRTKDIKHNEWFDIDEIYDEWINISDLFDNYDIEHIMEKIDFYLDLSKEELKSELNEIFSFFEDLLINPGDVWFDVLKMHNAWIDSVVQSMSEIRSFLKPFNYTINVDEWIDTEYHKRNEMQDIILEGLDFWEDNGYEPTKLAKRYYEFRSMVVLNESGREYFRENFQEKGCKKIKKANKSKLQYSGGQVGDIPVPKIFIELGSQAYKELEKLFKEGEDKPKFEQVIRGVLNDHYQDGNLIIFNKDDKFLVENENGIQLKPVYSLGIIGASQLSSSLCEISHKEKNKRTGKTHKVVDNSPIMEGIYYKFDLKRNKPEVFITGMGPGVDTAAFFAVLLWNLLHPDERVKIVLAFPGNIIEYFNKIAKYNMGAARALFALCLSEDVTMMSFLEEDHTWDPMDPQSFDLKNNVRNNWIGDNSNELWDFLSKNIGGTRYTCDRKEENLRKAKALKQTLSIYKKRMKKESQKYGLEATKYWSERISEIENFLKMHNGLKSSKPKHIIDKKYIEDDPAKVPLNNWEIRVKKSNSGKEKILVEDMDLCLKRKNLIKIFNPFIDEVGNIRFEDRTRMILKLNNKELIVGLRVILGRDFKYIHDDVKKAFKAIINKGFKDGTYELMDSALKHDKSIEYYDVLGEYIDMYWEAMSFAPDKPYKPPAEVLKAIYDKHYTGKYTPKDGCFDSVKACSKEVEQAFKGLRDDSDRERISSQVLEINHQLVSLSFITKMQDVANEVREENSLFKPLTIKKPIEMSEYKTVFKSVLASDIPWEEVERLKNSIYESWKLHYLPIGKIYSQWVGPNKLLKTGGSISRGPLYVTVTEKVPSKIEEKQSLRKRVLSPKDKIKNEILGWADLFEKEAGISTGPNLAKKAMKASEDTKADSGKWFKEGTLRNKLSRELRRLYLVQNFGYFEKL